MDNLIHLQLQQSFETIIYVNRHTFYDYTNVFTNLCTYSIFLSVIIHWIYFYTRFALLFFHTITFTCQKESSNSLKNFDKIFTSSLITRNYIVSKNVINVLKMPTGMDLQSSSGENGRRIQCMTSWLIDMRQYDSTKRLAQMFLYLQ